MSDTYTSGPVVIYKGRTFVKAGIGTIGWNVVETYQELDSSGQPVVNSCGPLEWFFPGETPWLGDMRADEKGIVYFSSTPEQRYQHWHEEALKEEAERKRLEDAAQFPAEGISAENRGGEWIVWRTPSSDNAVFVMEECTFCGNSAMTIHASEEYPLYLCRGCLNKIFDVFEQKVNS